MDAQEPTRTPAARALWRGITKRCAFCGTGHLFRRWFVMAERCPGCGLRFRRLEGHWSGDIGINTIVTFSLLWLVLIGGTLAMWGRINYVALGLTAAFVTFVFPILFVPFAKTLWVAVDVIMRPVQPDELAPDHPNGGERQDRPSGAGPADHEREGAAHPG